MTDGPTLRNGLSPQESGRRGAAARERSWLARVNQHREELERLATPAIVNIGDIITGEARPATLAASTAVLDRIGLGPTSKTEVTVGPSEALASLIERLDAREASSEHGPTIVDVDSEPTLNPPSIARKTDALAVYTPVDATPASTPVSVSTPDNRQGT